MFPDEEWMRSFSAPSGSSTDNYESRVSDVGGSCMLPDGSQGVVDFDGDCVPVEGDFGWGEPQAQVPQEEDDWLYDQLIAGPGAEPEPVRYGRAQQRQDQLGGEPKPELSSWLSQLFGATRGSGGMYGGSGYLPPTDTSASDTISQAFDPSAFGMEPSVGRGGARRGIEREAFSPQAPQAPQEASQGFGMPDHYSEWLPEEKEPTSFLESLKGLEGEEGSPQRGYYDYIQGGGEMTPEKIAEAEAYAASMGTSFDPTTGYSRQAFEDYEAGQAPLREPSELAGFDPAYEGQSLSDFLAYRDDENYQTRQTLDPQGRFRRESSIPGLTPEQRSYVTDIVMPGQAAYDRGSFGRQPSIVDGGLEDEMPSLGHFRNLARAKGFKGNRNMPAARKLMQEEKDRRQQFSLDARREQRLGRPKQLTPQQQREADLRVEKLELDIQKLRESGELTPYEIEANKLDLESKKLRNEKTQAEVNELLSKRGVEPQDWTPRQMGEFLKIVEGLRVGFNRDGELTDFEGLDSDLTPDNPKYKLIAGSAIGRAWAGIEEEPSVEASQPRTGAPRSGEIRNGFRFKGGNPNDKSNWEKV